jgi:hypothetical protein
MVHKATTVFNSTHQKKGDGTLSDIKYSSKTCHHLPIQDPILSVASLSPISESHAFIMFLLPIVEN